MDKTPQTIAVYLIDGFALMSFASVAEPLRAANLLAGRTLYDIQTIPVSGEEAKSSGSAIIRREGGQASPDLALV
ncbi:GlxA family transcriptional regulator, partial [Paracoccaceae bacterium]|nr:GlxA family transcriptional regulator [Paracoccaceae bacterium]